MGLKLRMWILVALLFGALYGLITGVGTYLNIGNVVSYIVLAVVFLGIQYLVGPYLVSMMMKVKYVSESEEPELHQMVAELSRRAGIPKPKVGISQISIPNAFAFGKTQADGRVCITQGIRKLLNKDELKAVIGHEISHLKHRDMIIITLLSIVPLIFYWVAQGILWGGTSGNRKDSGSLGGLVGIGAMGVYFISNLLVLYGSRIREYYADEGSVKIGNSPHRMASALYKLAYASSQVGVNGKGNEELRRIQGFRALLLNDTSQGWREVRQLKELDRDSDGAINQNDLLALRSKEIRLGPSESLLEVFTTHPNMLKRVKRLATLG